LEEARLRWRMRVRTRNLDVTAGFERTVFAINGIVKKHIDRALELSEGFDRRGADRAYVVVGEAFKVRVDGDACLTSRVGLRSQRSFG